MSLNNKESVTIIYAGEISRLGYERITEVCEQLEENHPKKVDLILSTYGGDPNAGFRIARCLQHYFTEGITLYVPHYCKSAGTLIAIGATELVLSDGGELGPLDVQLIKSDEMFERSSGMDITQGFNVLAAQAYDMFHTITVNIRMQSRLSTKLASEAASQITVGAFAPIFAQIDPTRLGEIQRATEIAFKYGDILKEKFNNMQENGVRNLVVGYPSHGFVIDRKEARKIFNRVRAPHHEEVEWLKSINTAIREGIDYIDVYCENINTTSYNREDVTNELQPSTSTEENPSTTKGTTNDLPDSDGTKERITGSKSRKPKGSNGNDRSTPS